MKKLSLLAAVLLSLGFTACHEVDNPTPVVDDGRTTIMLDGVQYKTDLVATFAGEVGSEVSLTLGVYDRFDIYGVDFGDGEIIADTVCYQNGGLKDENGYTVKWRKNATKFTGTVAGDGIVKVYGNSNLWYIVATGGLCPTSLDQEKIVHAVQVSITGADVENIELPAMAELTKLTFNNSPLKTIDVSKAKALTSLTINNSKESKYEPQLTAIDLSQNTELAYLSILGNTKNPGKLTSIDLTKNTKLSGAGLYLQNNALTEVKLGENSLTTINVQNNKLTALDTDKLSGLTHLYAANNELTTIDVSKMEKLVWLDVKNNKLEGALDLTPNKKLENIYVNDNLLTGLKVEDGVKALYFDNNKMIFSTMPELPVSMNTSSKIKQFHFAPQNGVVKIALDFDELDLTAETKKKGILAEEADTKFRFFADDKELVEGTDYTGKDGKFTFLRVYDQVYGVLTTDAYPEVEITTTKFAIKTKGTKN